jgi:hypothetical protein
VAWSVYRRTGSCIPAPWVRLFGARNRKHRGRPGMRRSPSFTHPIPPSPPSPPQDLTRPTHCFPASRPPQQSLRLLSLIGYLSRLLTSLE